MNNTTKKYPHTVALYKNKFSQKTVLNSYPSMDQEQADKLCAAIQAAVGGFVEIREKGGLSQNGKKLPDFELQAVTVTEIARRKEYGAKKKSELQQGDDTL
jgi:hypothetical protein